jgi:Protein of unknown function (DUF664)
MDILRRSTISIARVAAAANESPDRGAAGLVHMIEETARHVGDADILREQIDGATGK